VVSLALPGQGRGPGSVLSWRDSPAPWS